jgi:hypothetical protein
VVDAPGPGDDAREQHRRSKHSQAPKRQTHATDSYDGEHTSETWKDGVRVNNELRGFIWIYS